MDVPSCCCADWVAGLARDHATRLAAVARREGLAPADALDAVQDALHALIARDDAPHLRDRPDDAARVLVAIVKNAARNARRRHHRAKPHVDVELASGDAAPDAVLEAAETHAQLAGCLAGLAELHRNVVTLRVLEELSGDEAAKALGLTPGHVAVLLHRARKALADCMGDGLH
ncbi:MAG TPA: sigma-70 family RNA polymerase sigma factor [Kofleriaceae bacterium]|jgi:RNA polymerase sigma-70 factor (ECF subfamily)|nr:sigma-70 family RNA polymerase sigma factor [Kofleriaceae bacterium]